MSIVDVSVDILDRLYILSENALHSFKYRQSIVFYKLVLFFRVTKFLSGKTEEAGE